MELYNVFMSRITKLEAMDELLDGRVVYVRKSKDEWRMLEGCPRETKLNRENAEASEACRNV